MDKNNASSFKGLTYHRSCLKNSNDEEKQLPCHFPRVRFLHAIFSDNTVRRVLKCTLAYFISTLFSLYRPLAGKLGPAPFLISTGVLYSHPGRTIGAQLDTTMTGAVGILFAIIYPLSGIAIAVGYKKASFGSIIGCQIIHSLFLFGGIFFAQYIRQIFPKLHYFSLQFMIIQIFVITRDLDYQSIPLQLPLQYGLSLLTGHIISLAINILVWPETAVDGLGQTFKETVICSKDMLHMITQQFFLDPKYDSFSENDISSISNKINSKVSQLNNIYRDAKYEVSYAFIHPQQLNQVRKLLNRLTKHLGLLGGCLNTERELFESAIKILEQDTLDTDYDDYDIQLLRNAMHTSQDYLNGQYNHKSRNKSSSSLGSIATMVQDLEEEDLSIEKTSAYYKKPFLYLSSLTFSKQFPLSKPKKETEYGQRHLLMAYLESLKKPLIELSLTCSNTLECICDSMLIDFEIGSDRLSTEKYIISEKFTSRHDGNRNCNCSQKMRLAILAFDKSEREQMHELYHINRKRLEEPLDFGLRQELFLIFFFINTMREIANVLKQMTSELDLVRFESRKKKQLHLPSMTMKIWNKWARGDFPFANLIRHTSRKVRLNEELKLSNFIPKRSKSGKSRGNIMQRLKEDEISCISWMLRIRFQFWLKLQFFNTHEFKFSLKLAIAVIILCLPAFFPSSKKWYSDYKGQWAALTVISIMNPTSGGTFNASFWRIIGTIIGALVGWSALEAGDGSPYFLALFAVFLAMPFFYIHLATNYTKVGIVCLITYTVIALGRYISPIPEETISTTVWKRSLTLIVGICVALILNSTIWPFAAQRMVRKTIAGCIEQLEDHYLYINSHFLYHDPNIFPDNTKHAEKQEKKIQITLHACSTFLELTDHEICFQGPFPKAFYKEIITSMQKILNHMISIKTVLLEMPITVKKDICEKEYHANRKEMISAILLSFHTLASSLRSKTALPVYMPSARVARNKLVDLRRSSVQMTHWIKFRNLTWFSMAYSTEEIISELEYLFDLIQCIVGENTCAAQAQSIDQYHTNYL